jgi:hypothetical protein
LGFVILFFCIFVTGVEKIALGAFVAPLPSRKSHFPQVRADFRFGNPPAFR